MRTYRKTEDGWYCDQRSLWKRARSWVIWIGGWEEANGRGWRLRVPSSMGTYRWMRPTPVSLFGHTLTIYHGFLDLRLPGKRGYLHIRWHGMSASYRPVVYISRDGSPRSAHHWIVGTPPEIRRDGDARADRIDQELHARRIGERHRYRVGRAYRRAKEHVHG